MSANDQHQDDRADIILRINQFHDNYPYVRRFISPFTIYLACAEQIKVLHNYQDSKLNFDGTGDVIRVPFASKRALKYLTGIHDILDLDTSLETDEQKQEEELEKKEKDVDDDIEYEEDEDDDDDDVDIEKKKTPR
ncbi:hypothetical protein HCN44_010972 [Aphidius gifuensis]|uniref:Uncharacterized protein n=1 Tax=Aphidius gifuensis TaxID=684658 RepID=A0A835CVY9_APHGI|nr:hypothetical protein HCN44_010972 [Aphidius gifuensis]